MIFFSCGLRRDRGFWKRLTWWFFVCRWICEYRQLTLQRHTVCMFWLNRIWQDWIGKSHRQFLIPYLNVLKYWRHQMRVFCCVKWDLSYEMISCQTINIIIYPLCPNKYLQKPIIDDAHRQNCLINIMVDLSIWPRRYGIWRAIARVTKMKNFHSHEGAYTIKDD